MTKTSAKFDIYEFINNEIIAQLENGVIPWLKPWTGRADGAYSRATGKPYSLLNQFLLGGSGEWATFKQITEAGGKIKKRRKGSPGRLLVSSKDHRKRRERETADR